MMKTMKKPVFPRIVGLLLLYGAVFALLVVIQFTKQGNFTLKTGNLVIAGQYRPPEDSAPRADGSPENPNEQPLSGGVSVYFGGLEFRVSGGDGFALVDGAGNRSPVFPETMILAGDTAAFRLSGGAELAFNTHYSGGSPELRISGTFPEDAGQLEIPIKPLKSSRVREAGDGGVVISAGGTNYTFGRSAQGALNGMLSLTGDIPISYRAVAEKKAFSPDDFIVPRAADRGAYESVLIRWRDQNFSLWNRTVASRNDEELVIAYEGEAVRRGNYKAAVSAVSPAFLSGSGRTHESSVFLGGMDQALRSFTAAERDRISRLSRQINEKSPDFLKEPHVFEFFAVRGYFNFLGDGQDLVRAMDPAVLPPDLAPGIFEGFLDMGRYRPNNDNPFERLADQACFVISESIRRDGDNVLVFKDDTADTEFNLRLGKGLLDWGESSGHGEWAAVGRSLILTVLAFSGESGTAPASFVLSEDGTFTGSQDRPVSAARLYRILNPGEYYPRAAGIGAGVNGLWAWTAAASVSAAQENNVLDISVSFPAGETHYMMIRGVRPFTKIQLYNMDFRTDPQFERYDSSGWVYSAQDQILVLKMKHRALVEHVRIFY
jgi:hypothetical protein